MSSQRDAEWGERKEKSLAPCHVRHTKTERRRVIADPCNVVLLYRKTVVTKISGRI